eukprot:5669830-Pleurochrysis_carterae.AAC.1
MKDASIREVWGKFLDANPHLFDNKHRRMWRQTLRKLEDFLAEGGGDESQSLPLKSENVEEKRPPHG